MGALCLGLGGSKEAASSRAWGRWGSSPSLCPALTCVEIVALVLQDQGPQAARVLVPEVGGHEDRSPR